MPRPRADDRPPQPPTVTPRLRLSRAQRIGLPVLGLAPLLALAGVFGERAELSQGHQGALHVVARVPTRLRYRQRMSLELSVSNRGRSSLSSVKVRIDSAWLDRFSSVTISPPPAPDGWVGLGALAPGASVRASVSLEGERPGSHHGVVTVADEVGDTVRLPLSSLIFP